MYLKKTFLMLAWPTGCEIIWPFVILPNFSESMQLIHFITVLLDRKINNEIWVVYYVHFTIWLHSYAFLKGKRLKPVFLLRSLCGRTFVLLLQICVLLSEHVCFIQQLYYCQLRHQIMDQEYCTY